MDETTLQRYRRRFAAEAYSVRRYTPIWPQQRSLLKLPIDHAQGHQLLMAYHAAAEQWQSAFAAMFGFVPRQPIAWQRIVGRTRFALNLQATYMRRFGTSNA